MRRLSTQDQNFKQVFADLLAFETVSDPELIKTVDQIIADVRQHGDAHVLKLTQQFDRHPAHHFSDLELSQAQLKAAFDGLNTEVRAALELAATRIREFHQRQKQDGWTYVDALGNTLGQKVTPLDRVGIYVPGGLASYPSSVLMNAIPAHVAGVTEIIMVVPAPNGELNPLVLAAAHLAGVHRVFTIGGAQAVAALAYGTATIPAVDKITGPGNRFVAAAKRAVFGQVGIDMIAGHLKCWFTLKGRITLNGWRWMYCHKQNTILWHRQFLLAQMSNCSMLLLQQLKHICKPCPKRKLREPQ